jgi:hypothetical protein
MMQCGDRALAGLQIMNEPVSEIADIAHERCKRCS